jgi:hypothetical protein
MRSALLALLLLACGSNREAPAVSERAPAPQPEDPPTPMEDAADEAVAPPPEARPAADGAEATESGGAGAAPTSAAGDASAFVGTWVQAEDPTGAIVADPLYEGSRIELGADGRYGFTLGGEGSLGTMRGTWEATAQEGDTLRYRVTYPRGRTAEMTVRLRRVDGAVVGLEVGDADTGRRYHVRADAP